MCKGQKFLLTDKAIEPCPKCSTGRIQVIGLASKGGRAGRLTGSFEIKGLLLARAQI